MELITGENDKGRRVDRVLRKALPEHPLPLLHRLLRQGKVFVNGKPVKAQSRLDSGVKISIPSLKNENIAPLSAPLSAPLADSYETTINIPQIIWQGEGLIAFYKPSGLAVHGDNSLDTQVRILLSGKLPPSLSFTPGPLHRLDKPSSGIVVFSTSIDGARTFSSLMRERKIKKTYLAIMEGNVEKEEIWEDALVRDKEKKTTFVSQQDSAGKTAVTKIIPLATANGLTFAQVEITTGRTHQIRAQAAFHGHPLLGDQKYGSTVKHGKAGRAGSFFLHAWKLEFLDTIIEAPLPQAFSEKIKQLFEK
ncbi:MAG: RluA family pseudouridine synthase [Treponema sp.]|jgi:23S rRNA pseudouridine955/2504/2580 synthase|nr:RluA family pseudouridine synthase [Treponema sp.]